MQVKACRRLVEKEQLRIAGQGLGQEQPLLLAARQTAGRPIRIGLRSHRGDHAGDALPIPRVRNRNPPAMAVESQSHQLNTAQGQVGIERASLRHISDARITTPGRVACNLYGSGSEWDEAGDRAQ